MVDFINSASGALTYGRNNDVNRSNYVYYSLNKHDYNNHHSRVLIDNFASKSNTISRALYSVNNNDYDLKTKTFLCGKADVLCSQKKKSNTENYKVHIDKSEKSDTVVRKVRYCKNSKINDFLANQLLGRQLLKDF